MVSFTTELFIYLCTVYTTIYTEYEEKNGQMAVATTSRLRAEKYV